MVYYRRRLPHWVPPGAVLFVTWRLAGSLPPSVRPCRLPEDSLDVRFFQQDAELARCAFGPAWLGDPRIAGMVAQTIRYGESGRGVYRLHAWVIMPHHVQLLIEPRVALSDIMRWLKGRTGRKANRQLGQRNQPFWQDESFDHWVRGADELRELVEYIEANPVQAELAGSPREWPWSSARGSIQGDQLASNSKPFGVCA